MSSQTAVGGAVLGTAVGAGTANSGSLAVAESAQTLAFTGASHTLLIITVAFLMIIAGLLLNGLSRRHSGLVPALASTSGPTLRL